MPGQKQLVLPRLVDVLRIPRSRGSHRAETAGLHAEGAEDALLHQINAEIDAAAEAYLAVPRPDPSTIFDFTYAELPADLLAQKHAALDGASSLPEREAAE